MLGSVRRGNGLLAMMAALALLLLAGVLFAKPAHAETFTVNSTTHPGDGACDATQCTLKEAINAANSNGESDTIGFASGLSGDIQLGAEAGGFTIQNDSPEEDLRINGPGAGVLAIDGNGQVRPFEIASGVNATIEGLTIENGNASTYGGGISNSGTSGTLTLANSTISGNSTSNYGGGIYNIGTLTVTNSTISGNSAPLGGGIRNDGTLTVTNSTISGNSTSAYGGGGIINKDGTLTVTNSTISGNSAGNYGGGIYNWGGTSSLANTIVAGNSANLGDPDASGDPFTSQGYNLIGNTGGSSGWIDSDLLNQDALLGPLQDNGGPTKTHALLVGSPALNAIPKGTNGCGTTITKDQRGVKRPQAGKCEIGSLEEDVPPTVTSVVPLEGATGIAPGANVNAFFSEAMRAGSINTSTVKLFKVEEGPDTPVDATVNYGALAKKATLDPIANLVRGARYKAVVTTGAKDLAGNRLDQDPTLSGNQPKTWFFTVRN